MKLLVQIIKKSKGVEKIKYSNITKHIEIIKKSCTKMVAVIAVAVIAVEVAVFQIFDRDGPRPRPR